MPAVGFSSTISTGLTLFSLTGIATVLGGAGEADSALWETYFHMLWCSRRQQCQEWCLFLSLRTEQAGETVFLLCPSLIMKSSDLSSFCGLMISHGLCL